MSVSINRRQVLRGLALGGSAVVAAPFTARAVAHSQDATPGPVVFGMWSAPQMVSPHTTNSTYSLVHSDLIFSTLTRQDAKGAIAPGLAERWEIDPSGTTYTFQLNQKAVWHDGQPVTAEDVAFSLTCLSDPRTKSIYTSRFDTVQGMDAYRAGQAKQVAGFQVVSPYTFTIRLGSPVAPAVMLGQLGAQAPILPKHVLGSVAPDSLASDPFWSKPTVGSGPFKFSQYKSDQYMELDRNDRYYLGVASFPKLILRIGDQNVLEVQLASREVDIAAIPPQDADTVAGSSNVTVHRYASTVAQALYANLTNPALQDPRVRQAMAYAIDRAKIAQITNGDASLVCNGPVNAPDWAISQTLTRYGFDADRARRLLADAKWDSSTQLTYRYPSGNIGRERMAPLVQAAFKEVGINIKLQLSDFATLQQDAAAGKFDLLSLGNQNSYDPSSLSNQYMSNAFPPAGVNYGHYADARVDEIFTSGQKELDQSKRAALYHEFQDIVTRELPRIWVMLDPEVVAVNKRIVGIAPAPSWGLLRSVYWNIVDWKVSN